MIQKAFGNEAMGRTQVKEWMSVESDEHSGGPRQAGTRWCAFCHAGYLENNN